MKANKKIDGGPIDPIDWSKYKESSFYENPILYTIPSNSLIRQIETNDLIRNDLDNFVKNYNANVSRYNPQQPTLWRSPMGKEGRTITGYTGMDLTSFDAREKIKNNNTSIPLRLALGGSINQDLNADSIRVQEKLAPNTGKEIGLTLADILTGNTVQAFTGKSISGYGGVNQGKGSGFSQLEDAAHGIAAPIIGSVFPMAKPFIEARQGIRSSVAGSTGGYSQDGGALLGEQGAGALAGMGNTIGGVAGMFGGMGGSNAPSMTNATEAGSGMMSGAAKGIGQSVMTFANGGRIPAGTNFGKIPNDPNMPIQTIEGNRHENGGTMIAPGIEAEKGETIMDDYIFSDRMKVPGSKRTFAQESKIMQDKYKLRPDDKLAQAQLNKELQGLAQIQDSYKNQMQGFMGDIYTGVENDAITLKMADGGDWRKAAKRAGINTDDFQNFISDTYGEDWNDVKRVKDLQFYIDSYNESNPRAIGQGPTDPTLLSEPQMTAVGTPPVDPTMSNQPMQRIPLNNTLGIVGSSIGPLANFAAAAFAPDGRLNRHVQLRTTNTTPAEIIAKQQSNEAIAAGLYNFRNAPTAGSYLGNVATALPSINQKTGATLAGIRYQGDLNNNQILNQQEMVNQQIDTANNLIQDQSTAQRWNLGMAGAQNLGQNLMGINRDINANNAQNTILPFISTQNYSPTVSGRGRNLRVGWNYNQ